jgi:Zn-dependent protease with chaperone function
MIASYLPRLLCLCLACFFLIHLALGLIVMIATPALLRKVEALRPRTASALVLALRLFPSGFALLVVGGLCVPSYLRFEPEAGSERVGLLCLAAAIFASILWASSIGRAVAALVRSHRYVRGWQRAGRMQRLVNEPAPACVVNSGAPIFALTGILRSQIVVSERVLDALSADQLRLALDHERAHQRSHDNLKRLMVLLAPGLLPFYGGFWKLERGAARFVEWAADDVAAGGNQRSSMLLAEALVAMARLMAPQSSPPLVAPLLAAADDLPVRVDRLLRQETGNPRGRINPRWSIPCLLVAGIVATALFPWIISPTHEFLEYMIR